jgi:DnaJ like chaperone protein
MGFIGKLIGGSVGLWLGSVPGAVVGLLLGHFYDRHRDRLSAFYQQAKDSQIHVGTTMDQIAFTVGIITLGAKMAKSDGAVSRDEIDAFKRVFRIPPEQEAQIGKLFDQARRDAGGYEPYARQLAYVFRNRRAVLEELLSGLVLVALADGAITPPEQDYLRHLADIFGFNQMEFARILASSGAAYSDRGQSRQQYQGQTDSAANDNAYAVLGVSPAADNDSIKVAYRKLIREHHPDKLMAAGVPADFMKAANEKMQRINAAYDQISRARGIK